VPPSLGFVGYDKCEPFVLTQSTVVQACPHKKHHVESRKIILESVFQDLRWQCGYVELDLIPTDSHQGSGTGLVDIQERKRQKDLFILSQQSCSDQYG